MIANQDTKNTFLKMISDINMHTSTALSIKDKLINQIYSLDFEDFIKISEYKYKILARISENYYILSFEDCLKVGIAICTEKNRYVKTINLKLINEYYRTVSIVRLYKMKNSVTSDFIRNYFYQKAEELKLECLIVENTLNRISDLKIIGHYDVNQSFEEGLITDNFAPYLYLFPNH